ncbi:GSCOCG00005220001-RA-CDS [Cotesia congregata]|nr:GSCOCG00005220001-RA-CDS [Cotesia congregata]
MFTWRHRATLLQNIFSEVTGERIKGAAKQQNEQER